MASDGTESQTPPKSARLVPEGAMGPDDHLASENDGAHRELILTGPEKAPVSRPREGSAPAAQEPPAPKAALSPGGKSDGAPSSPNPDQRGAKFTGSADEAGRYDTHGRDAAPDKQPKAAPKPVSAEKVKLQSRLPALDDDVDIGREKEQIVTRDGKPDLGFTGTLLASASTSAPKGRWQEYRVYSTATGKHVFSKITRSIFADETDKHEADVFDPAPASVSSQLLRSARDLTRSRPMTWMDAAVGFFGYDPTAKALYRKLSVAFEERI